MLPQRYKNRQTDKYTQPQDPYLIKPSRQLLLTHSTRASAQLQLKKRLIPSPFVNIPHELLQCWKAYFWSLKAKFHSIKSQRISCLLVLTACPLCDKSAFSLVLQTAHVGLYLCANVCGMLLFCLGSGLCSVPILYGCKLIELCNSTKWGFDVQKPLKQSNVGTCFWF